MAIDWDKLQHLGDEGPTEYYYGGDTASRIFGSQNVSRAGQEAYQQAMAENGELVRGGDTKGDGFFGTMKDAADAGFFNSLAGTARFASEFSPFGGDVLNSAADALEERATYNTPVEQPTGANYVAGAIGNALGSGAAAMAQAAVVAGIGKALGVTAVGGATAAVISKIPGLSRLTGLATKMWNTPFGKLQMAQVAGSPFEAMAEAGNLVSEMRQEGYTDDEIKQSALTSAGYNMAWLTVANMLEAGAETKVASGLAKNIGKGEAAKFMTSPLGMKEIAKRTGQNMALGALGEGAEEFGQNLIGNYAKGEDFNYEDAREAALQGAIGGAFLHGTGTALNGMLGDKSRNFNIDGKNYQASNTYNLNGQTLRDYTIDGKDVSAAQFFAEAGLQDEDGSTYGLDRKGYSKAVLEREINAIADDDTEHAKQKAALTRILKSDDTEKMWQAAKKADSLYTHETMADAIVRQRQESKQAEEAREQERQNARDEIAQEQEAIQGEPINIGRENIPVENYTVDIEDNPAMRENPYLVMGAEENDLGNAQAEQRLRAQNSLRQQINKAISTGKVNGKDISEAQKQHLSQVLNSGNYGELLSAARSLGIKPEEASTEQNIGSNKGQTQGTSTGNTRADDMAVDEMSTMKVLRRQLANISLAGQINGQALTDEQKTLLHNAIMSGDNYTMLDAAHKLGIEPNTMNYQEQVLRQAYHGSEKAKNLLKKWNVSQDYIDRAFARFKQEDEERAQRWEGNRVNGTTEITPPAPAGPEITTPTTDEGKGGANIAGKPQPTVITPATVDENGRVQYKGNWNNEQEYQAEANSIVEAVRQYGGKTNKGRIDIGELKSVINAEIRKHNWSNTKRKQLINDFNKALIAANKEYAANHPKSGRKGGKKGGNITAETPDVTPVNRPDTPVKGTPAPATPESVTVETPIKPTPAPVKPDVKPQPNNAGLTKNGFNNNVGEWTTNTDVTNDGSGEEIGGKKGNQVAKHYYKRDDGSVAVIYHKLKDDTYATTIEGKNFEHATLEEAENALNNTPKRDKPLNVVKGPKTPPTKPATPTPTQKPGKPVNKPPKVEKPKPEPKVVDKEQEFQDKIVDKLAKAMNKIGVDVEFSDDAEEASLDGGKVILPKKQLKASATVQQFTHLWNAVIAKQHPQLWGKIVECLKKTPTWKQLQEQYDDETKLADAVMSQLAGENANKRLKELKDAGTPTQVLSQLRAALKAYWDKVKLFLHEYLGTPIPTLEEQDVLDMPLRDLLEGNIDFKEEMPMHKEQKLNVAVVKSANENFDKENPLKTHIKNLRPAVRQKYEDLFNNLTEMVEGYKNDENFNREAAKQAIADKLDGVFTEKPFSHTPSAKAKYAKYFNDQLDKIKSKAEITQDNIATSDARFSNHSVEDAIEKADPLVKSKLQDVVNDANNTLSQFKVSVIGEYKLSDAQEDVKGTVEKAFKEDNDLQLMPKAKEMILADFYKALDSVKKEQEKAAVKETPSTKKLVAYLNDNGFVQNGPEATFLNSPCNLSDIGNKKITPDMTWAQVAEVLSRDSEDALNKRVTLEMTELNDQGKGPLSDADYQTFFNYLEALEDDNLSASDEVTEEQTPTKAAPTKEEVETKAKTPAERFQEAKSAVEKVEIWNEHSDEISQELDVDITQVLEDAFLESIEKSDTLQGQMWNLLDEQIRNNIDFEELESKYNESENTVYKLDLATSKTTDDSIFEAFVVNNFLDEKYAGKTFDEMPKEVAEFKQAFNKFLNGDESAVFDEMGGFVIEHLNNDGTYNAFGDADMESVIETITDTDKPFSAEDIRNYVNSSLSNKDKPEFLASLKAQLIEDCYDNVDITDGKASDPENYSLTDQLNDLTSAIEERAKELNMPEEYIDYLTDIPRSSEIWRNIKENDGRSFDHNVVEYPKKNHGIKFSMSDATLSDTNSRDNSTSNYRQSKAFRTIVKAIRGLGVDIETDAEAMVHRLRSKFEDVKDAYIDDNGKVHAVFADGERSVIEGFYDSDNGVIYVNGNNIDANIAMHEFTHLWTSVIREQQPQLWKKGVALLKQTKLWDEIKNSPLYKNLENDDEIADEVLARLSGVNGAKQIQKVLKSGNQSLVNKIVAFVKRIYQEAKNLLTNQGLVSKDMTLEEFVNMPFRDLMNAAEATSNGEMVGARYAKSEASDIESEAFKKWFGNSILKDKDGNPQVFYRGLGEKYDVNKQGEVAWISESKDHADAYTSFRYNGKPEIQAVYAHVENPLYLGIANTEHTLTSLAKNKLIPAINEAFRKHRITKEQGLALHGKIKELIKNDNGEYQHLWELYDNVPEVLDIIKDAGYDALSVTESGKQTYGVIGKSNVKSATNNNGNYDSNNGDIRFAKQTLEEKAAGVVHTDITPTLRENLKNLREHPTDAIKSWGKKLYKDWLDKNFDFSQIDDIREKNLGRSLRDEERIYDKVQGVPANAEGDAFSLLYGDETHMKTVNSRLRNVKMKHPEVTMKSILEGVKDSVLNSASKDFLKRFNFKDGVEGLGNVATWRRLREMDDIVKKAHDQWEQDKAKYDTWKAQKDLLEQKLSDFKAGKTVTDKNGKRCNSQADVSRAYAPGRNPLYEHHAQWKEASGKWAYQHKKWVHNGQQGVDPSIAMKQAWLDKCKQEGWEAKLTEPATKLDEEPVYKLPNGLTRDELDQLLDAAKKTQFWDSCEKYYQLNDNVLCVLEDAGVISKELHDTLNSTYKEYCPLQRDFSDTAPEELEKYLTGFNVGGTGIANVSDMIKHISKEGSDNAVINPLESTTKVVQMATRRAERNKACQAFVKLAKEPGMEDVVKRLDPVGYDKQGNPEYPAARPEKSTFTVMENGRKITYQTKPEYYDGVVGYNEPSGGVVWNFLSIFARTLRKGATTSPSFVVRNGIRDTFEAACMTDVGFKPVLGTLDGLKMIKENSELLKQFEAMGITSFTRFKDGKAIYKNLSEIVKDKNIDFTNPVAFLKSASKMGIEKWMGFNEAVEVATRLELFKLSLEKSQADVKAGKMTQAEALEVAARVAKVGTIDFSRSGLKGQKWNQVIPFFNATLQGTDMLLRRLANPKTRKHTAYCIAKYFILPSMTVWAMNSDKDWWKELDPQIKYSNWCIDENFRIPMAQSGSIFGGGWMAMLDATENDDPKAMANYRNGVRANITPNIIPTFFLPIVEWQANYSFFTGKPVVSKRLQNMPDELQYTNGTADLSRIAGKYTGLSPVKIDNTVRNYLGTMGMTLYRMAGLPFGEDAGGVEKKTTELPFIRDFVVTDSIRNRYINDFYELQTKAAQQHAGYGKKGQPTQDVRAINAAGRVISGYQKQIRDIEAKTKDPVRARQQTDVLRQKMNAAAKKAVDKYGKKYLA